MSGAYPLMLTVEHEDGELIAGDDRYPPDGYAVIKLNGHVIKKIKLLYSSDVGDRGAYERYAADWLVEKLTREG